VTRSAGARLAAGARPRARREHRGGVEAQIEALGTQNELVIGQDTEQRTEQGEGEDQAASRREFERNTEKDDLGAEEESLQPGEASVHRRHPAVVAGQHGVGVRCILIEQASDFSDIEAGGVVAHESACLVQILLGWSHG
jgi:hypothetical protein